MLEHLSSKLFEVRVNTLSRRNLILYTYSYLHYALSKGFYHESLMAAIWNKLVQLSATKEHPEPDSTPKKCNWCKNGAFYTLMRGQPYQNTPEYVSCTNAYSHDNWEGSDTAGQWTKNPNINHQEQWEALLGELVKQWPMQASKQNDWVRQPGSVLCIGMDKINMPHPRPKVMGDSTESYRTTQGNLPDASCICIVS